MMRLRRAWRILRGTAVLTAAFIAVADDLLIHVRSRWHSHRLRSTAAEPVAVPTVEQVRERTV
ncbi:hypothetical protein [Microbispora sp. H10949]|uniref:hypothetical protein n=1 Tax=Microbispora sp. H10949 TaxID=2729111 RepID=UPI0016041624|nr:hypothetical protein [Microbispora sp. H10949]